MSVTKYDLVDMIDMSKIDPRIKKLLEHKPQTDPYRRYTILSYQLAGIGKSMRYSMIYPDQKKAHIDYLKTELSDLLIQTIIFAKLYDLDVNELLQLGIERLEEFKKHGNYEEK